MTDQSELHDLLRKGIELARTGQHAEARAIFEQVIRADEYNEVAWLWMAAVAELPAQRREALEIVLEINPHNQQAREALDRLGGPRARRKAEQAQALADRIGSDATIDEKDFQPTLEPPPAEPTEETPEPSTAEQEAQLAQELIKLAREDDAARETPPPEEAPPEQAAGAVDYYDFAAERRARRVQRVLSVLPGLLLVIVGAALVAVVIYGAGQILQPIPPTSTPTPGLQTALALIATDTPTPEPFVIVTVDQDERFLFPATWTPSHTPTATASPTATPTPLPPQNYRLIYSGRADGATRYNLYSVLGDGSEQTRLTTSNLADDRDPSPGVDGRSVVYVTNQRGGRELVQVPVENGRLAQSSSAPGTNANGAAAGTPTARSTTPDLRQLTGLRATRLSAPSWSPDGFRLTFSAEVDGQEDIYITDLDGNFVKLTDNGNVVDRTPAWSPTGGVIVFASDRGTPGETELYSIHTDGSELTQITDSQGSSSQPAWSPDGRFIVFVSDRDRDSDLYVMNADGSNEQLLTRNDDNAEDRDPAWSPDGRWIAFATNRATDTFQLYMMEPAPGADALRVTTDDTMDAIEPGWMVTPLR